jgi:hypothetical protein
MKDVKKVEIKINVKETPKEYINGLILGLVYSGYEAYFGFDNENICFTGWDDEIVTFINEDK